jgi:hypothetical protein
LVEAAKLRGKTADKTANFKLVLCTGDWYYLTTVQLTLDNEAK